MYGAQRSRLWSQTLKSLGLTDLYWPPHSAFVSQANSIATAPCLPRGFTLQKKDKDDSQTHQPPLQNFMVYYLYPIFLYFVPFYTHRSEVHVPIGVALFLAMLNMEYYIAEISMENYFSNESRWRNCSCRKFYYVYTYRIWDPLPQHEKILQNTFAV